MTAAFDTLAAAEALEAAGMEPRQAKACAAQLREAANAGQDALATKADLSSLRQATQADLSALEARLTWRIVGLVIAANALLVAAVKLIP